ncbi:TOMM precursor leader peptide-binding protein [Myxococcus landrumensis]|uniref:TOMM leader peptide-binding protein n=1 Tax=Myxococcus landrumensis TaxID=2813577 RepID=A0ABX7N3V4_9BACT|nr:TOMM precursor leader peptide-binding protein [Myxococcus landrumus]QSQ13424.1 TOMM precursor leader peptide-binding protein [Myxococcus landrumus]
MSSSQDDVYRLAPGTEVVPLRGGGALFRSDTLSLELEGASTQLFVERILPLLDGQRDFTTVAAALPGIAASDLREHLDSLVNARVLKRMPRGAALPAPALPFFALLEAWGLPLPAAQDALSRLRVVVLGLEAHGAHAAGQLADCGVGEVVLVDPYPCEPGNVALMPGVTSEAVGLPRQQVLARALESRRGGGRIVTAEPSLSREGVEALVRGASLALGCFDQGLSVANQWLNRAGVTLGVPTLYGELTSHVARVGPLVLPGNTACFMCYRMRSLACADDFETAMAWEEHLDQQRTPRLHTRATLPSLAAQAGSLLAQESLKLMLGLRPTPLSGHVLELDALRLVPSLRPVLEKPDCPVCSKKAPGPLFLRDGRA